MNPSYALPIGKDLCLASLALDIASTADQFRSGQPYLIFISGILFTIHYMLYLFAVREHDIYNSITESTESGEFTEEYVKNNSRSLLKPLLMGICSIFTNAFSIVYLLQIP